MVAYEHWQVDYVRVATEAGIPHDLPAAVTELNGWITELDGAGSTT